MRGVRLIVAPCGIRRLTYTIQVNLTLLLLLLHSRAGYWLEEAAAPYFVFTDAGYEVEIASPEGGTPPVDAGSKVRTH